MLQFLREKGKSWALKGILAFVALTFVAWGGLGMQDKAVAPGGRVAAWVNEAPITVREFEQRHFRQSESMRRQLGAAFTEEMARRLQLRRFTLSQLIFEKLQLAEAERLEITVSDTEVGLLIQQIPQFQQAGRFDAELYRRTLSANGVNPRQFEEQQRKALILARLRRYLGMAAWVSAVEVKESYRLKNEKAHVATLRLDPAFFAKGLKAAEADLRSFFDKNKNQFRQGPKRKATWWYLPFSEVASRVQLPIPDLRARYEATQGRYQVKDRVSVSQILIKISPDAKKAAVDAAREKLEKLRRRALGGEDFAALARAYSQGPAAKNGGDIGTFGRGEVLPAIEKAAFSLPAGAVSPLLKTSFGFHLLKVRKRQRAKQRSFEEAQKEVEKDLRVQKSKALAKTLMRKVRYAVEDGKAPAPLAGLRKGETRLFEQQSPPVSVPEGALFAKAVFALKSKGTVSRGIEGKEGALFVRLLDLRPAATPAFRVVRGAVRKAYLAAKGRERAEKQARAWLAELRGGGQTLAGLAAITGGKVVRPQAFARGAEPAELGQGDQLVREIFGLGKEEFALATSSAGDVFLIRALRGPSLEEKKNDGAEKQILRRGLLDQKRNLIFRRHMESLRQGAKVRLVPGFKL